MRSFFGVSPAGGGAAVSSDFFARSVLSPPFGEGSRKQAVKGSDGRDFSLFLFNACQILDQFFPVLDVILGGNGDLLHDR